MTAHGDNPQVHRIEVERDSDGDVERVRFVCDADNSAPCHIWPDCGCETWTEELHGNPPAPGHEPAPQSSCWIDPWFNDALGPYPSDWIEAEETGDIGLRDLVSGPVSVTFEGEWMTWQYATVGAPA